jgi:hypothetical protein
VQRFATTIARTVYIAPRDATVAITLTRIGRRHSRTGRSLDVKALQAAIEATVVNPAAPHKLRPARAVLRPKVTSAALPNRYPTILTIDRDHFKLRLFAGTAKTYEFTSQFFFDETLTDTVHALSPYSSKGRRDTINTRDGIYNGLTAAAKAALTLATSPGGSGYAGIINLGVQVG